MTTQAYIKSLRDVFPEIGGKRFIIAGGGTGGHIFPGLAIANAIKRMQQADILFVGALGKIEMEKVPMEGFNIVGLNISGYNRSSFLKNLSLPIKLLSSIIKVRQILKEFKPDAVIGVGGYSSFPVLRVAQTWGIPTFIHESNSLPGKSNIILAKRASRIFVGSEGMNQYFPPDKVLVTGNPVREIIGSSTIIRKEAIEYFKLDSSRTTILIVGGSLGARSINMAIESSLPMLLKNNLQIIWQTGKLFSPSAHDTNNKNISINQFINKMEYAYAAADIVVSRAGAMAISELCVVGKPVIFVPYPHASEDHQTHNAMKLVDKEAALMIRDEDVSGKLADSILHLAQNVELRDKLRSNIRLLAKVDADDVIAKEILNSIK